MSMATHIRTGVSWFTDEDAVPASKGGWESASLTEKYLAAVTYMVMTCIVMAYIVMAYIAMACMFIASAKRISPPKSLHARMSRRMPEHVPKGMDSTHA